MRVLVVTAHPLAKSLSTTFAAAVEGSLREAGHDIRTLNLYEEAFQPALTAPERIAFYAGEDALVRSPEMEALQWSEALILIFPTWWFGFPAILKGWFDRVWAPGVAYNNSADFGPITPALRGLKRMLVITTLGSPWWIDRLVMRQPLRRTLKSAILGACAPRCRLHYMSFYKCETLAEGEVQAMVAKAKAAALKITAP